MSGGPEPGARVRHRVFRSKRPLVRLFQFNQAYDDTVYLPLSIGMLRAACKADPRVSAAYRFAPMVFVRDRAERLLERCADTEIAGFSLYVWNERLSLKLAEALKRERGALVVLGGPSVPNDSEDFLRRHDFVDVLVHGEGERTFVELLDALQGGGDLRAIRGLSFLEDGVYRHTGERERLRDLDALPSPFLDGSFDELLGQPYRFQGIWETNRGCPFACTFCYWGSNLKAKVSSFSMERLERELEWMAARRMEFIYAADANFGMLPRDLEICDRIIRSKRERGYPKSFFINYAKNSGDRVFEIARRFHEADLSKGTTLSLQSLDGDVLEHIKRKNIKMSVFQDLQRRYREAGVPSYTELILPLPGETLSSFVRGLEETIAAGEHDQIYVHLCRLLPNTEMATAEARQRFGLKTRWMPILSSHVNLGAEALGEPELEEVVVETAAMPREHWQEALAMSWMAVTHICLKVSYFPALYLHAEHGTGFTRFLQEIRDRVRASPERFPLLAREERRFASYARALLEGDGELDTSDLGELEPIRWPIEEVSFMVFSRRREQAYGELGELTEEILRERGIATPPGQLEELFDYQQSLLVGFEALRGPRRYRWDWPRFFARAIAGEPERLAERPYVSELVEDHAYASFQEFARFHVWYGRRRKKFTFSERARTPEPQQTLALA